MLFHSNRQDKFDVIWQSSTGKYLSMWSNEIDLILISSCRIWHCIWNNKTRKKIRSNPVFDSVSFRCSCFIPRSLSFLDRHTSVISKGQSSSDAYEEHYLLVTTVRFEMISRVEEKKEYQSKECFTSDDQKRVIKWKNDSSLIDSICHKFRSNSSRVE